MVPTFVRVPPELELPSAFTFSATAGSASPSGSYPGSNVAMIFDYVSPTDFKFVSARIGGNRMVMGQRTAAGWQFQASQFFSLASNTNYDLSLAINGSTATLRVGGTFVMSHDFGESLSDGRLGVGAENAIAWFDDISVL